MGEAEALISYAQNREDIILYAFFRSLKQPGFYVDVGAYHPEDDSVTKFFYERGWHGINIEPSEDMFQLLQKQRPKDTNLNVGVSDKIGTLEFRQYANKGLSTFSKEMRASYQKDKSQQDYTDTKIKVTTLADIFEAQAVGTINFLKIDVEGMEYEVLAGNNWDKYRPQVLCIEANHVIKDWRPLLKKQNYTKLFFDGLNEYYVANECQDIAKDFSYVDTLLLGPPIIDVHTHRKQAQIKKQETDLQKRSQDYEKEIERQQFKVTELETTLEYMRTELTRQQGLKQQIKAVYASLDNKIMRAIDRRGYARKTAKSTPSLPAIDLAMSKQDALKAARIYDANAYFQYHPQQESMKLHYRVTGKLYRTTRNAAVTGARHGYRLTKKVRR